LLWSNTNFTLNWLKWADPGGTAKPGQPATEVEQAPQASLFDVEIDQ